MATLTIHDNDPPAVMLNDIRTLALEVLPQ
jgi:hypothetical protein